jgi:Outer membrane lipoprotein-sorting protein
MGVAAMLLALPARAQQSASIAPAAPHPELALIVDRMQQAQAAVWPTVPYQVVREYRLFGEKNPAPTSDVVAEVDYLPPDSKSFVIQQRLGSSRGEEVVRRILQHESHMTTRGRSWSAAAIDELNYSFSYLGETTLDGNPCYLLGLSPKHREPELVRGQAWIDQRSYLVRQVEGQTAKNPSWWVKRVDVKLDFADVGGAWLQTNMEAAADVRFLGHQTLKAQTIEARVGDVVARKTAPTVHRSNRPAASRQGVPATVFVPMPRRD